MALKFDLPASLETLIATNGTITGVLTVDGYIINPAGAQTNQVLKYNGAAFIPANETGGGGSTTVPFIVANDFPGADIGAKINAADAYLGSNNGVIVTLPGNYSINTQVLLGANGGKRKLILGDGYYDNNADAYSATTAAPFIMYDNTEICAEHRWGAIVYETVNRVAGITSAILDYNTFTDNSQDGNFNVTVRGIYFARKADEADGISGTVQFGNSHNVLVEDCYYYRTNGFCMCAGGSGLDGYFAEGVRFLNNVMIEAGTQNIAVVNGKQIQITGNYMKSGGAGGTHASTFIDLECNTGYDHMEDFIIADNIIDARGGYPANGYTSLQVVGGGDLTLVQNGAITGNVIIADHGYNAVGISVGLARRVLISNNLITGHGQAGIILGSCDDSTVALNRIVDVTSGSDSVGTSVWLIRCHRCDVYQNTCSNDTGLTNWEPGITESDIESDFGDPSAYNTFHDNVIRHTGDGNILHDARIRMVSPTSRAWNNVINQDTFDGLAGVSDIAALQAAFTPGQRNDSPLATALLLGANTIYDSQPALYKFDAYSTETENAFTVIKPTSTTGDGRWLRIPLFQEMSQTTRDGYSLTSNDAGRVAIFNTTSGKAQIWNGTSWDSWSGGISGSLTSGRVPYASGSSTLTDSVNLTFDGYSLYIPDGYLILDGYQIDLTNGASSGQVLKYNGSEFIAANESGGAGSFTVTSVKTSTYTASDNQLVRCNPTGGGFSINLPAAAGNIVVAIKNQSSSNNTITILPNGGDTIDGLTLFAFSAARGAITLYSDGVSDWMVL